MERAAGFTAVPGWGGVLMGLTALVAAAVAHPMRFTELWLPIWLGAAAVATAIGLAAIVIKARRSGMPLAGPAGRTFALAFSPAIGAGAILTFVLYRNGSIRELPGMWLLLYGTAVTSGGTMSIRAVPMMGLSLMALGVAALLATVAAQQLGGVRIADAIGKLVVEVLARAFDAIEQAQRIDVELLDGTQRGDGGEEIGVFVHVPFCRGVPRRVKRGPSERCGDTDPLRRTHMYATGAPERSYNARSCTTSTAATMRLESHWNVHCCVVCRRRPLP